jgi:hypothetical protein
MDGGAALVLACASHAASYAAVPTEDGGAATALAVNFLSGCARRSSSALSAFALLPIARVLLGDRRHFESRGSYHTPMQLADAQAASAIPWYSAPAAAPRDN